MTYAEKFKCAEEYEKYAAKKMLDQYKKDGVKYYSLGCYRNIDLLTFPEFTMSEEAKEDKIKAMRNIGYLQSIIDGVNINPIYTGYYIQMQNKEYPDWRK